jgi:hypothetical protein
MQRTVAEARRVLEQDVIPRVNDHWANEWRQVLAKAEDEARTVADRFVADREEEVLAARDAALRELTACRDAYDDLTKQGAQGRVSAREYAAALGDLRRRQTAADAAIAQAVEQVEQIEDIEDNPIAFFDQLVTRTPRLKPEFPW